MIAVSGVMYRIFANMLKDLVTDWCVKKGKIPDTQFGFFPGRSTLHPLFFLRHLRHAAKKLKPRTSPRLHVALLIFRKRMTLSLGNNSGHICVVVLCHLLCSAWSSICMRMMSTF